MTKTASSGITQVLPPGMQVLGLLSKQPGWGELYEAVDTRLGKEVRRLAQVIDPRTPEADWTEPLLDRLRQLVQVTVPHVALPLEAGRAGDGKIYIVSNLYKCRLEVGRSEKQPSDRQAAEQQFRQVLTGLAGLHAQNIVHGDVRAKNVVLSDAQTAWLANTAVGPLAYWSGGELLDDDSKRYYPPEWRGKTREPSIKADLYATGLLACELYLGRTAIPAGGSAANDDLKDQLALRLKRAGVRGGVRHLIRRLVAPEAECRPANAADALVLWQRLDQRERLWPVVWAGAAGLVVLLVAFLALTLVQRRLSASHEQLAAVTKDRDELRLSVQRVRQSLATEVRQRDELLKAVVRIDEIHQLLREKGEQGSSATPSKAAIDAWSQLLKDAPRTGIPSMKDAVGRWQGDEAVHSLLKKWAKQIEDLANDSNLLATKWYPADSELRARVDEYVRQPWDESRRQKAEDRLVALCSARDVWMELVVEQGAEVGDVAVTRFDNEIGKHGAEVQQILHDWRKPYQGAAALWRLRHLHAGAEKGHGTSRYGAVQAGDRVTSIAAHEWQTETNHTYKAGSVRDVSFNWRLGEPLSITLNADYSWYAVGTSEPALIDHEFRGPIAVWRAHYNGGVTVSGPNGPKRWLGFEIVDCPGPPISVFTPSVARKAKAVGPKSNVPIGRKQP